MNDKPCEGGALAHQGEHDPIPGLESVCTCRHCPFCGAVVDAEFCNVGVGMVQCTPYSCQACDSQEFHPYIDGANPADSTDEERAVGWWNGGITERVPRPAIPACEKCGEMGACRCHWPKWGEATHAGS